MEGDNLYGFCANDSVGAFDWLGLTCVKFMTWKGGKDPFEMSDIKDIDITTSSVIGDWGQFITPQPIVNKDIKEKCTIVFYLSIELSSALADSPTKGAHYLFRQHYWGGGSPSEDLPGGSGVTTHGSEKALKAPTKDHEMAHARAWWEVVRPCAKSSLKKYCGAPWTASIEAQIKRDYDLCLTKTWRDLSVQYANAAERAYFDSSTSGFNRIFPAAKADIGKTRKTVTLPPPLSKKMEITDWWVFP